MFGTVRKRTHPLETLFKWPLCLVTKKEYNPTGSPLLLPQGRNKKLKWLKNTKTSPKMFLVGLLLLYVIYQLWKYRVINVNMTFFNSSLTSYLTNVLILPHNFFGGHKVVILWVVWGKMEETYWHENFFWSLLFNKYRGNKKNKTEKW